MILKGSTPFHNRTKRVCTHYQIGRMRAAGNTGQTVESVPQGTPTKRGGEERHQNQCHPFFSSSPFCKPICIKEKERGSGGHVLVVTLFGSLYTKLTAKDGRPKISHALDMRLVPSRALYRGESPSLVRCMRARKNHTLLTGLVSVPAGEIWRTIPLQ